MTYLSSTTAQTMSSREIADLTGKEHRNVMRDIRQMLAELHGERGVLRFEHTYVNKQNGQQYPEFCLPKRETLVLIAGYSITLRAKIIDRWQELEAQTALPSPGSLSRLQLIEIAMQAEQERLELERKVQADAPKVEFHDRVTAASGDHTIDQAAKMLGTGQRRLFSILRERHLLRRDNLPYQQYVDRGLFRVAETPFLDAAGHERLSAKTVVTGKGLIHLQQMLSSGSAQGSLRV